MQHSKLSIPFEGPHCLRHSLAVHLLKSGTPLKTIGDILGHRTAESTSMYLRLATGDLRGVSLAVPRSGSSGKGYVHDRHSIVFVGAGATVGAIR